MFSLSHLTTDTEYDGIYCLIRQHGLDCTLHLSALFSFLLKRVSLYNVLKR